MGITQVTASLLASLRTSTLIGILFLVTCTAYYAFLRKSNLDIPGVVPDPGPEGVFNTLTRMYERVSDPQIEKVKERKRHPYLKPD